MADPGDLSENPFAALFPSIDVAKQYSAESNRKYGEGKQSVFIQETGPTKDPTACTTPGTVESDPASVSVDLKQLAREKTEINFLLENVFLITVDMEPEEEELRPTRCVYMENLAESLAGQTWLDDSSLEQAVFERLLMDNPGGCVVSTRAVRAQPKDASQAGESEVLRYLYMCYERLKNVDSIKQFKKYTQVLARCEEVILLNAKTCLQQSELYPTQMLHKQFVELYLEHNDYLSDSNSYVKEFFIKVSTEIEKHKEDGTLNQVFRPALDLIAAECRNFTIMHTEVNRYMDLLMFFTQTEPLAQVFMEYNTPKDGKTGKEFERTLIGSILSLSCVPEIDGRPSQFFTNPSSATKQEHDITEKNIWQPLTSICAACHQLIFNIIKLSPDCRHLMMSWIGNCLQANSGRAKIWSAHAPQVFSQMYCSDGFILNLGLVLLKLCEPFSTDCSPKLLKIQPSYVRVVVSDQNEAKERGVHAQELIKETPLIPFEEDKKLAESESYNFITECFFLCHQAINLGFHTIHGKFLKINQELHRIQQIYQDLRQQYPNDDIEPVRTFKQQMEKGMTLYLSLKAALTLPKMLETCLKFHIATASWLVQVARCDDVTDFQPIKFPLPQEVPASLAYIPDFIMGNVTDFTMFLHRFKDEMYETGGESLHHFMTLILVFMGSPERMKNPHLRAELAETLAALMPQNPDQLGSGGQGLLSKYYREMLFANHPLINHLSEKLLHVFVSIEMTGQSVQFEQKFNYRRPMYLVLEYIWEKENHRNAIKELAGYAEEHIEDTDPPLFLRFINLLINDAIFLLDEALDYMKQLKEKQQIKDGPEWGNMSPRQQQDLESNMRQIGMIARYHNVMGRYTIHSLELITREIKTIFCHAVMVDRIAGMLNYFLLHLVGPKQRDFKVKDKEEYEFKPDVIVSDITKIYLNLSDSEDFCKAVSGDGRSYSPELFPKAIHVLQKIGKPPAQISDFQELHDKISAIGQAVQEEEELLADAPDEFLDPITSILMKEPVILPSGNTVDKSVIARHLLSDQNDPFNRQPLTLDMVKPDTELKQRIQDWIEEKRQRKT